MAKKPHNLPFPGLALGILLQRYLDNPPINDSINSHNTKKRREDIEILKLRTRKAWADKLSVSTQAIGQWMDGSSLPNQSNLDLLIRFIFGTSTDPYQAQIEEIRSVHRQCKHRRIQNNKDKTALVSRLMLTHTRIHSDLSADLPSLTYYDIDRLPVEEQWFFEKISYGEGVQIFSIPGRNLFWLNPSTCLSDSTGSLKSLTTFLPKAGPDLDHLAPNQDIFFPRRIIVSGIKEPNAIVRIFACTDMPYPSGLDDSQSERFQGEAILGVGGIAAFLNRHGEFRQKSNIEMGQGLGCVVALVAITYVDRRPLYRSPYCLVIRKGIRYPDDVWISPTTNQPVMSKTIDGTQRFLFQSRESKGGSFDMFVANYNGTFMVNLNETDETAWDGFTDEDGNDLTSWIGNTITFGSTVTGNGFIEKIRREDRLS